MNENSFTQEMTPIQGTTIVTKIQDKLNTVNKITDPPLICPRPQLSKIEQRELDDLFFTGNKNTEDLYKYIKCYQREIQYQKDYWEKYKASILSVVDNFYPQDHNITSTEKTAATATVDEEIKKMQANYAKKDLLHATLTCMLFRESARWVGGTSDTGAVGLGQHTEIAIADAKIILEYKYTGKSFEKRRDDQHIKFKKDSAELKAALRLIDDEERKHKRFLTLQKMWKNYDLKNPPRPEQLTKEYFLANKNYRGIIALVGIHYKNCMLQLESSGNMLSERERTIACAGAYNMGVTGFAKHALDENNNHLVPWLNNLSNSNSEQKNETTRHLISINRCVHQFSNYPPCGTDADYCEDETLYARNPCENDTLIKKPPYTSSGVIICPKKPSDTKVECPEGKFTTF